MATKAKSPMTVLGEEIYIEVHSLFPTKPLMRWSVDTHIWNPPLVFEWGIARDSLSLLSVGVTILELYTKSHTSWRRFTRQDIWVSRADH